MEDSECEAENSAARCCCWQRRDGAGAANTTPPAAGKPASVEGGVRNAITGMPVERAHISLRRYNNGGWDKYGAVTNAEGKYTVTGIPAATYPVR